MLLPREELEEIIAKAICDSHPLRANRWNEIVSLSQHDGYMVAKGIVKNTRIQAAAVLQALLSSLPTGFTTEQITCGNDLHGNEVILEEKHYDERAGYYQQLLGMRK